MSLRIYSTLARAVQAFAPLQPGHVRMYVCGMTVYDLCHLGHARSMIAFDVVQRWLRASGLAVTYVRNITDIDDKIIRRAVENGESIRSLTDRMIAALHQDADALGVQRPTHEPRATDYVPQMLGMIGQLEQKGLAYQAGQGGDVNFAVRQFPGYGRLSGKSMRSAAGGRAATGLGAAGRREEGAESVMKTAIIQGPCWHTATSGIQATESEPVPDTQTSFFCHTLPPCTSLRPATVVLRSLPMACVMQNTCRWASVCLWG